MSFDSLLSPSAGLAARTTANTNLFSAFLSAFNLLISLEIVRLLKTQKVEGQSIGAGEKEKHPWSDEQRAGVVPEE